MPLLPMKSCRPQTITRLQRIRVTSERSEGPAPSPTAQAAAINTRGARTLSASERNAKKNQRKRERDARKKGKKK